MKNIKYKSAWYSQRNFANEGVYVYGTVAEIHDFSEKHVAVDCGWGKTMNHNSFDAAKRRCEREAQADRRRHTRCNEVSCIYVCSASDVFPVW